jgi:cytochrome oxidase Cu insertion factor (SCO1/SenC/PrrC family)
MLARTTTRRVSTIAVIAALGLAPALGAQALGPKDGAGLAPTDTGRVMVGQMAPDFTLEVYDGSRLTLSEFRGKRHVILVFYRGHW